MSFAEGTTVPAERSRAEIESMLRRYGASQFVSGWDTGRALIGFFAHGRQLRFVLAMPKPDEKRFTVAPPRKGSIYSAPRPRSAEDARRHYEAEIRRLWRALALVIKAKLEAVESGIAPSRRSHPARREHRRPVHGAADRARVRDRRDAEAAAGPAGAGGDVVTPERLAQLEQLAAAEASASAKLRAFRDRLPSYPTPEHVAEENYLAEVRDEVLEKLQETIDGEDVLALIRARRDEVDALRAVQVGLVEQRDRYQSERDAALSTGRSYARAVGAIDAALGISGSTPVEETVEAVGRAVRERNAARERALEYDRAVTKFVRGEMTFNEFVSSTPPIPIPPFKAGGK